MLVSHNTRVKPLSRHAGGKLEHDYQADLHNYIIAVREAALRDIPGAGGYMNEPEKVLRVVVIDDDPDMIKVIKTVLRIKGAEVLEALSGWKGYALVKRELPDLVLLDIMLPDIDGYEVLRKLRLDAQTSRIPIVFVSAKTGSQHAERGLSLGAQGYVPKPFTAEKLMAAIDKALAKPAA
jgi:CheY-like chemotaxis protein